MDLLRALAPIGPCTYSPAAAAAQGLDETVALAAIDPVKERRRPAPDQSLAGCSPGSRARCRARRPAVLEILDHYGVKLEGAEAVVRRPLTAGRQAAGPAVAARHATVTMCHTRDARPPGPHAPGGRPLRPPAARHESTADMVKEARG